MLALRLMSWLVPRRRARVWLGWLEGCMLAGLACWSLMLPARTKAAPPPRVEFDVAPTVACRDITPYDFAAAHPTERLIEVPLTISSLIRQGSERDLVEFMYRIECGSGPARMVDHLPRTEVATSIVGPIEVEKKDEKSANIGLGAASSHEAWLPQISGSAAAGAKTGTSLKYALLPRKELLAASGTFNRERGVFFKLRPSSQTSLEGARQFIVVLRVPRAWRADELHIHCQALGLRRGPIWPLSSRTDCGSASFRIGLYERGDEVARQAAARLVQSEERLLELLQEHARAVRAEVAASPIPGYADLKAAMRPATARQLLGELEQAKPNGEVGERLPPAVRGAATEWRTAVEAVRYLSGELAAAAGARAAATASTD